MSTTTDGYNISRPKRQLRCPGCFLPHEEHEFGEPGKFCDGLSASILALGVEKHMVKESGHENEVGIKLKKETDTHNAVKPKLEQHGYEVNPLQYMAILDPLGLGSGNDQAPPNYANLMQTWHPYSCNLMPWKWRKRS